MSALTTVGVRNRPGRDATEQFALGEPVLDQAGMDVDGPRQRDPVDRQLLIINSKRRQTRKQGADNRQQTDDETQPNHVPTQQSDMAG